MCDELSFDMYEPQSESCVQNGGILRADWVAGCENKESICVFSMGFFFNFTWSPILRDVWKV